MSIKSKLYVDDNVYNILQYDFSIKQPTDSNGIPVAFANGKEFHFKIEGDKDTLFFEWVSDPKMMKNCKIEIPSRFGMSKGRTIELYDVYCSYSEDRFNSLDQQAYTVSFALSSAQMVNILVDIYGNEKSRDSYARYNFSEYRFKQAYACQLKIPVSYKGEQHTFTLKLPVEADWLMTKCYLQKQTNLYIDKEEIENSIIDLRFAEKYQLGFHMLHTTEYVNKIRKIHREEERSLGL